MISPDKLNSVILHGLGVEGRAALHWLLKETTAQITVIDHAAILSDLPIEVVATGRIQMKTEAAFTPAPKAADTTLYLRSPGIGPTNPVFARVMASGLQHTTPTGYWLLHAAPRSLVTVTGTKGKSSTTQLTVALLSWLGMDAVASGNIGTPPFDLDVIPGQIIITELSSYMMHDLPPLPYGHYVTSIYREHTPWHGSHEAYVEAKLRPYNLNPFQRGVIPADVMRRLQAEHACRRQPGDQLRPGCHLHFLEEVVPEKDGLLIIGEATISPPLLNEAFSSPGALEALRMAIAICLTEGFAESPQIVDALKRALPDWRGLPSRQCVIPTMDERLWIDDALATVPEATLSALARWKDHRTHLLLGGLDRGQDFTDLMATCAARENITLYTFGDTELPMRKAADKAAVDDRLYSFRSFKEAIKAARAASRKKDVILFSPAAPTGPPHKDYQERAAIFAEIATRR